MGVDITAFWGDKLAELVAQSLFKSRYINTYYSDLSYLRSSGAPGGRKG